MQIAQHVLNAQQKEKQKNFFLRSNNKIIMQTCKRSRNKEFLKINYNSVCFVFECEIKRFGLKHMKTFSNLNLNSD